VSSLSSSRCLFKIWTRLSYEPVTQVYIGELDWKNICPSAGDGYHFDDFMSLSYKSIFYNPELFGTDVGMLPTRIP